jgi:alpha-tubulin suppressor-like RCC1 family protein
VPVRVAGGHAFAALVAGNQHTCGLTEVGVAYCWGDNYSGQTGCSPLTYGTAPTSPCPVGGHHRFTQLTAGDWHTCGLTSTGTAYCWGDNFYGQLGNPAGEWFFYDPVLVEGSLAFTVLVAGGEHTCGLRQRGDVYCWGWNYSGQLGRGTFASPATDNSGQLLRRPLPTGTRQRRPSARRLQDIP